MEKIKFRIKSIIQDKNDHERLQCLNELGQWMNNEMQIIQARLHADHVEVVVDEPEEAIEITETIEEESEDDAISS